MGRSEFLTAPRFPETRLTDQFEAITLSHSVVQVPKLSLRLFLGHFLTESSRFDVHPGKCLSLDPLFLRCR